ncbi:hypothetical protein [Nostoc sp. DSM 114167]|jgi:hypothetical protein|uniref:hypothetical protein n=1 Tax=Nostoc sp. DSM 114167 TaxID=3439050 RepID=UPI004045B257
MLSNLQPAGIRGNWRSLWGIFGINSDRFLKTILSQLLVANPVQKLCLLVVYLAIAVPSLKIQTV